MKAPLLVLAIAQTLYFGAAQAQVVADSACEKYAVDIAAFATCDSPTRVARDAAEDDAGVASTFDRKTPEKRPSKGQEEDKKTAAKSSTVRAG